MRINSLPTFRRFGSVGHREYGRLHSLRKKARKGFC
jgi:hypothetical protein